MHLTLFRQQVDTTGVNRVRTETQSSHWKCIYSCSDVLCFPGIRTCDKFLKRRLGAVLYTKHLLDSCATKTVILEVLLVPIFFFGLQVISFCVFAIHHGHLTKLPVKSAIRTTPLQLYLHINANQNAIKMIYASLSWNVQYSDCKK